MRDDASLRHLGHAAEEIETESSLCVCAPPRLPGLAQAGSPQEHRHRPERQAPGIWSEPIDEREQFSRLEDGPFINCFLRERSLAVDWRTQEFQTYKRIAKQLKTINARLSSIGRADLLADSRVLLEKVLASVDVMVIADAAASQASKNAAT